MWLYLIAVVLVVVGIVGGFASGGIFTIVLIPLGLLALGAAFLFGAGGRESQRKAGAGADDAHTTDRPLPHKPARPTGRAPSSPERLADARRSAQ